MAYYKEAPTAATCFLLHQLTEVCQVGLNYGLRNQGYPLLGGLVSQFLLG